NQWTRTNGKAERFVQTSLPEWADAKPTNHSSERAAALLPFLHIKGQTPISRVAVNNLLRHDT
ncbi:MAG: IS481 family transposase, partial [Methylocella sp.]